MIINSLIDYLLKLVRITISNTLKIKRETIIIESY